MTSSRKRRPSSSRPRHLRRLFVMGGAIAVFAAALAGWFMLSPTLLGPVDVQEALARSSALLAQSNATAAREQALNAVRGDPGNGQAHLALAKALLALNDGLGAEAELQRTADAGIDARQLVPLRAESLLLQGEADKALALADKIDPRDRAEALRIKGAALTSLGDYAGAVDAFEQGIGIAEKDAALWIAIGRFKMAAGDVLGAIEASERAVKLAPGSVDALVLRAQMVRTQYGLVAALPWFEAALKRDPYRHDALIEYASTLGDVGRTVDALAATRRALEAQPGSPQALYLQAVIAARAGDADLARSLIGKTGGAMTGMPAMLLLGGSLDLQAGDEEQAIDKLRQLVDMQPMNITARKLLASALLQSDSARNAIDILRPVVERSDADSYSLTLVARGFERIGDRAAAAKYLDRAAYPALGQAGSFSADDSTAVLSAEAAQRPGDPSAQVPLIRALADKGDKAGALAKAQQIAARNRGAPAAQVLVGDMLMLMDRFGDAAAAYRQAADLRFDEPTMLRLVEALDRADRRADAANVLALFLSQNPVNVAALRLAGHWQLAAGEFDDAIDTLERLRARIGDGDAALNAELASAYSGAGENDLATDLGEAAYALAPSNPAVADAYGWALYRSGDLNSAVDLLQKAVALAPRHPALRWHLAQVYADLNRKPEARENAQAALADPRFTDRAAAMALVAAAG